MNEKEVVIDGVVYIPKEDERENTGRENTWDWNTGDWNTGNMNTGDWNTGNRNAGHWNTGNWNAGHWNTGNWNTGHWNTGDWNTGDRNTGNCNAGHWNTGNWNTGYLNTTEPDTVRIFNKECDISAHELEFPEYFYFDIAEWIPENAMTKEEKEENPTYKTTGGYLRTYEYQEAWKRSWNNTSDEDRRKTLLLPNWDNEIFKEISGIDVERELQVNAKEYSMDEVAKALGIDVKELKIKKE